MQERMYWLGFSVFPGIGPVTFSELLQNFGSAKSAWDASKSELQIFLGEKLLEKFIDFRSSFSFDGYLTELKRKQVQFLTLQDKEYPSLLKTIKKPPFVLYVKGGLEGGLSGASPIRRPRSESFTAGARWGTPAPATPNTIAVVGTRKITEYGREVTKLFTQKLVNNGFTIVSGLALGVDAVAHATAIENNGSTIAVLGCGVDCCLPSENSGLYDQILKNGGVILSELPLGHPPSVGSFPARNRIVAGLSQGVLVTEGAEDSGSLITAQCAFSEGRAVFAVPGAITSGLSRGPLELIKKGAKMVTSAEDIVRELKIEDKRDTGDRRDKKARGETKEEEEILELLEHEGLHFDALVRKTAFSSSKLGSLLTFMEMKGMIKSADGIFSLFRG